MDKVLIVDDDPIFLERVQEDLQKFVGQFEMLTASNGVEALEVLEKERISILVTDLDMPKMDGLELLAHMRKHRPQIPCVVLTEAKKRGGKKTAAPKTVLGRIAKPVDANTLFALIMEGLDRLDEGIFWREQRSK